MDWTQFTFIGGTVIAFLIKTLWFKSDTAKRDKVIPWFAFIGNLALRIAQQASGAEPQVFGVESAGTVLIASFWDVGVVKLVGITLYDTLLSWGTHRATKYRDAWVSKAPKRKAR